MSSTYWLESKLPLMLVLGLIDFMTAVVMMPMNVLGYALEKWPFLVIFSSFPINSW